MQTSQTLIRRVGEDSDHDAWNELVQLYAPLIETWLRQVHVHTNDQADLVQEVLLTLSKDLPNFEHNGSVGAFRKWLRLITINRCRRYWDSQKKRAKSAEAQEALSQMEDASNPIHDALEREHNQYVFSTLIDRLKSDFNDQTLDIFRRVAINAEPAKQVAAEYNIAIANVYKAKFRVMSRLQEEAASLFDSALELVKRTHAS